MPHTPPPSQWLVFLPFSGLVLNEPRLEDTYLFGDVTLASHEAFAKEFITSTSAANRQDYKADSYLVVRRDGVVNTDWFDDDRKNEQFMAEVRSRAKQIAGLLTIASLATSDEGLLVGLADQFIDTQTHFGIRETGTSQRSLLTATWGAINNTFTYADPEPPVLSYDDLTFMLQHPIAHPLMRVFEQGQAILDTPLCDSIVQSVVRLAAAIHATSYAEQLLGAVTSIELLFSGEEKSTTFKAKANRLAALIGQGNSERYTFKEVLQARHTYVHQGKDIVARRLPLQAICAAVHALLVYARVGFELQTKGALLTYLDGLSQQEASDEFGERMSTDPLGLTFLHHALLLPFADFVDKVKHADEEYEMGMYDCSNRVFSDDDDYDFDDDE